MREKVKVQFLSRWRVIGTNPIFQTLAILRYQMNCNARLRSLVKKMEGKENLVQFAYVQR